MTLAALTLIALSCGSGDGGGGHAGDPVRGAELYEATCLECHGPEGTGSDKGPPLVDDAYRPSHRADRTFLLAPYGSDADVTDIAANIRSLQRRAGIGSGAAARHLELHHLA